MEKRRGRREIEVTRSRRGGCKRGESNLASNQFPKCSPQPGRPREIQELHREEMREKGDRRDLGEKSVESLSRVLTLCNPMDCSTAGLPVGPTPTPGVYSNSCPLSRWCHPTISSSVIPFSSHLKSFPASGSFQMSPFFTSGGQSIRVSASASVLPMNIQDWFPLGWTGWISLQSKGLSRVFSNNTVQKHQFFGTQLFLWSNPHIYTWPLEKP